MCINQIDKQENTRRLLKQAEALGYQIKVIDPQGFSPICIRPVGRYTPQISTSLSGQS